MHQVLREVCSGIEAGKKAANEVLQDWKADLKQCLQGNGYDFAHIPVVFICLHMIPKKHTVDLTRCLQALTRAQGRAQLLGAVWIAEAKLETERAANGVMDVANLPRLSLHSWRMFGALYIFAGLKRIHDSSHDYRQMVDKHEPQVVTTTAQAVGTPEKTVGEQVRDKGKGILIKEYVATIMDLQPSDLNKPIEIKVYRKWASRNVPDPNPTGLCFMFLDKKDAETFGRNFKNLILKFTLPYTRLLLSFVSQLGNATRKQRDSTSFADVLDSQ
ncbi:hypothetical protein CTI12_AA200500 [Artemisia annua]|uniref:Uncharacterized protein n=1 Tax=Artemisia annua TaxID=35608 RepID=A0A2U1P233_ARTAN|nr:hypothetical protein CTI12_AA200500 [Artemisia annua]